MMLMKVKTFRLIIGPKRYNYIRYVKQNINIDVDRVDDFQDNHKITKSFKKTSRKKQNITNDVVRAEVY